MSWILIGIVAGSFIVSGHDSEESCLGRKAVLEKQKIYGICIKAPLTFTTGTFNCGAMNCTVVGPN